MRWQLLDMFGHVVVVMLSRRMCLVGARRTPPNTRETVELLWFSTHIWGSRAWCVRMCVCVHVHLGTLNSNNM